VLMLRLSSQAQDLVESEEPGSDSNEDSEI